MATSAVNYTDAPNQKPGSGSLIVTIFVINGVFIALCLVGLLILRWLQVKELVWFPPSTDENREESRGESSRNPTQDGQSSSNAPKKGRNDTLDSDDPEEVLRPNGQPIHLEVLELGQEDTAQRVDPFRFDVVDRDRDAAGRHETQVTQS